MSKDQWQTEEFEHHRAHLREVARRILGSAAEAEDALQEAWLRVSRSDTDAVENMGGWLTTVVSRICLDMLRARRARREELVEGWLPEPIVTVEEDPEQATLMADTVGLAMLVVLDTLSPPERVAFVLHDMFGISFEEIAKILDRSLPATRQLASRARRRVRGTPEPQAESLAHQRRVVEAFFSASREGNFEALLRVLDPDVVLRAQTGPGGPQAPAEVHGADQVARLILARGTPMAPLARPAIVDGRAGAVVALPDRVAAVVAFTVEGDRVIEMDLLLDPARLERIRV